MDYLPIPEHAGGGPVGKRRSPTPRLAGLIPASMLDWPGKIASTLFVSGCNFRCAYCHNPSLLSARESQEDWGAIVAHFRAKESWLDGVVVTGGEPTADPDLPSLLTALGELGIPAKIDTNGSNPSVLRHLIAEDLVSFVALDVKTTWERYEDVTGSSGSAEAVAESVRLLIESGIRHEFRTTLYPGAVTIKDIPVIARYLEGGALYALQQFRPDNTLAEHASYVAPYGEDDIRVLGEVCSTFIPTVIRGLSS